MICFAHEKGPLPSSFVMLDRLEAVLDRELAESIREGSLSPAQHGGVAIGVVQGGRRLILTYGEGRSDGLYEIGSVTKTVPDSSLRRWLNRVW